MILRDTVYYVPRNDERSSSPASLGRLNEPALLILASLCAGTKHGYAIIADVEEHTGKRLGPGTLYGAISRLERLGLIEGRIIEERGRRPYRITPSGRRAFQSRMSELRDYQLMLRGLAT
jgi:DNA-binding PadR family transcriptional regulator